MNMVKTAAFVLAIISPILGVAQRSQGRAADRKPSPATSATSTTAAQSGSQTAPGSQQLVTSENFLRANSSSNAGASSTQPAAPITLTRPIPAGPTSPVAPQVAAPSVATPVPAPVAQPVVSPIPSADSTAAVHYSQGQLTVVSKSASLGTVLKLISAKTGAVIDLAPELQNEPVIAQIGPSAVRDVMTSLLDSPKIDYIIMGTGAAPGGLERILVRTRQSFGRTAIASSRPSQPPPPEGETELKLNENGPPVAGVARPQTPLTQEQLMANWKKIREEKLQAEIEQQRQDRENENTQVQVEPQPQPQPQPENPPTDNPPLK